jgi:uncharacterized membrane protein HdeD (DUF308 family)
VSIALYHRSWWAWGLRGLAAIAFGWAAFTLASETLEAVVLLLAAYLVVDGILTFVVGVLAATDGRA